MEVVCSPESFDGGPSKGGTTNGRLSVPGAAGELARPDKWGYQARGARLALSGARIFKAAPEGPTRGQQFK